MGLKLDEIIEKLKENTKTAEQILIENLSEKTAEPVVEPAVEPVVEEEKLSSQEKLAKLEAEYLALKTEVEAEQAKNDEQELAKIAEADETGRIMARAFYDELQKLGEAMPAEEPVQTPENVEEELAKHAEVLVNLYNKYYNQEEK